MQWIEWRANESAGFALAITQIVILANITVSPKIET